MVLENVKIRGKPSSSLSNPNGSGVIRIVIFKFLCCTENHVTVTEIKEMLLKKGYTVTRTFINVVLTDITNSEITLSHKATRVKHNKDVPAYRIHLPNILK